MVTLLVLDVTEDATDRILLTFDAVSAMALADKAQMERLLATVGTENKIDEHAVARFTVG